MNANIYRCKPFHVNRYPAILNMANLVFEGSVSNISEAQFKYIRDILEERGFNNDKVKIEPVGAEGDNYVANVRRITVEKNGEIFKMIAKIAPISETLRTVMNTDILFRNEHVMYTEVLPKFTELEKSYDIPESDRIRYPICYGSYTEKPNEVILLEDMKELEYIMFDKFTSLTDDVVKIVLKDFAKLHGLAFVLKDQEPETFNTLRRKLINMWAILTKSPEAIKHFEKIEHSVIQMLADEKHKKLVTGTLSKIDKVVESVRNVDEDKYSVLQQGDCWTNNFLFKMNGKFAKSCCIIDYQLSNASSPAADILYMVLNCTDLETVSKHYVDWIDFYYSELEKYLTKYRLEAKNVYSRSQLDADLKKFGKMTLCVSLISATVLMKESADAQKFKESLGKSDTDGSRSLMSMKGESFLRVKAKLEDLIESCIHLGIL